MLAEGPGLSELAPGPIKPIYQQYAEIKGSLIDGQAETGAASQPYYSVAPGAR